MSDNKSESLSRRASFKTCAKAAGGVALLGCAVALPARAQAAKVSQAQAGYQDHPNNGQSCASCALFVPATSCQVVEGTISPAGWCKLYAKKS